MSSPIKMSSLYVFEHRDASGKLLWRDERNNTVCRPGLNHALATTFKGEPQTASWYLGLKGIGTPNVEDTMATRVAGWVELVSYSEVERPIINLGDVNLVNSSVNNSASKAVFTFSDITTVYGSFATSGNVKAATDGILYGAVDFVTERSFSPGDTLSILVEFRTAN